MSDAPLCCKEPEGYKAKNPGWSAKLMTGGVTISVVVPVKDEAGNAGPLAREIAGALTGTEHEIIFVDDGSRDGTPEVLMAVRERVPILRILRHPRNLGQSRAIHTGVLAARGKTVITLDGDGQNDPADIPKLLAALRADPLVGMVSGVRLKRRDRLNRRLASRLGNHFRNLLLADGAQDTGCGLKAFRREVFLALPYFDHMHRFLIALVLREGWQVRYVAVNHRPRQTGASKYSNFGRLLVSVQDLLGVRWLQRRHRGRAETREL
jgi:dolichol-phosphate mannosyltransferase